MKNKKIIELIEENNGSISMRTLNVLYNILIMKTPDPKLEDIMIHQELIDAKTSKMKKTSKEIKKIKLCID
jgi:hypothetical protein